MTKIYNRTSEKEKRRLLRKNMPPAEVILWSKIKGKQLKGYKFRRQYSVGRFVIDFYCPEIKLAIEVDGESHYTDDEIKQYDQDRQAFIESFGIRFVRFTNTEIYNNLDGVLQKLVMILSDPSLQREKPNHP